MKIISFGYTAGAVEAQVKTVTRRAWKDNHAKRFHKGDHVMAWNKGQRLPGAHPIAEIVLTDDPKLEPITLMPDSDYEAEGFAWLHEHPESWTTDKFGTFSWVDFMIWRNSAALFWVVRFAIVELVPF
jgi:hypothetical protein